MKKIVLTGGGTAGHVTPNIALIPELKSKGWEIHYIGTDDGIEKSLMINEGIAYHSIKSGKLRRYFDVKNITDPFKVIYGVLQAASIINRIKPKVIFSKGGFVSVPVVIGGWMNRVPVIIHESDFTPGLANRLSSPFAKVICINFPSAASNFKKERVVYTGTPIRKELLSGNYDEGLKLCGFDDKKPVVMVMGGSLGSRNINRLVRESINRLLQSFQVVHICGKGNIDEKLIGMKGYKQFEYISKEQPHIFKIADIIVSRAGANSIFEFLHLKLPSLLIPLPSKSSRGDQILNAKEFERMGFCKVLMEDDLDCDSLYDAIIELYNNRAIYVENMNRHFVPDGTSEIIKIINEFDK